MKRLFCLFLLGAIEVGIAGCMSNQALDAKLQEIEQRHNVVVKADNVASRFILFGDLSGLLERIDNDLSSCPSYFRDHIGSVIIEESFADNPEVYPVSLFVRGYVDIDAEQQRFPIHIKNRSIVEKILFFAPRDEELFLHEAAHSFEFSVQAKSNAEWERFYGEFSAAQTKPYDRIFPTLIMLLGLPIDFRPAAMPSLYGVCNHFEDFAETCCYLRRYNGDVEFLREKDAALYKKCKIVEKFTRGEYSEEEKYAAEDVKRSCR